MALPLLAELNRRRVFRALVVYGIAAFAVLQIIEPIMHGLHWPDAVLSYVVVALAIGFPIVVGLAWVFDVNAGRIERTAPATASGLKGARLAVLLVGVGVLAAAPGVLYYFVWRHAPQPQKIDRSVAVVAVLPFTVRGSEQFAYLGEGMVDLLSTNLSGGVVRTVDPHALLSYLGREERWLAPDRAREVAVHFGAGMYVLGTVLEADKRLRLIASLYETSASGAPVFEAKAEGEAARLFEVVDDLTSQLRARAGGASTEQLRGAGARFVRLAQVTTSSVEALKDYLEGDRQMRKGEVKSARDAFRQAVEADPGFALAWYRLAIAGAWANDYVAAREASRNAVAHSGRLSEQDRDRMVAASAFLQGKSVEAERLYRQILEKHPDDVDAWYMLGETLIHYGHFEGRPPGDAREPFEKTLVLDPRHDSALIHLSDIAEVEGRRAEFVALADRYFELYPSSPWGLSLPWARALAADDKEALARETAAIRKAARPILSDAFSHAIRSGRFREAEEVARLSLDPARSEKDQRGGHAMLSALELARGRIRAALAEAAQIADPADPTTRLQPAIGLLLAYLYPADRATLQAHLELVRALPATGSPFFTLNRALVVGSLAARLDDAAAVEQAASEAEKVAFEGTLPQDFAWVLRGEIAFRQGRPDEALAALQRMRNEVTYEHASVIYPVQRDIRGQILERQGRDGEAARWYTARAYNDYEAVCVAPLALRLARLEDKHGESDKAIAHYRQVVELWRDCDGELRPLVAEAQERLAALRPAAAAR